MLVVQAVPVVDLVMVKKIVVVVRLDHLQVVDVLKPWAAPTAPLIHLNNSREHSVNSVCCIHCGS